MGIYRIHEKSLRFVGEPQALNDIYGDWLFRYFETSVCVSALGIAKSTILTVSNQQNSNNVQANNANQSGQEHHEWNPPSFKRSRNPLLAYIIQRHERKYNINCWIETLFLPFLQKKQLCVCGNWHNCTQQVNKKCS